MTDTSCRRIYIDARHEVPHYSNQGITHLISIGAYDETPPSVAHFKPKPIIHRFQFADIWEDNPFAPHASADDWPSEDKVRAMIEAFKAIPDDSRVLFHCTAGISRSTAAAFIYLVTSGMTYEAALHEVVRVRTISNGGTNIVHPNILMVKHADNVLGHKGGLTQYMSMVLGAHDYPTKWGATLDLKLVYDKWMAGEAR